ncbi:MAG: hypothetical protein HY721_07310 [Planctomycetes bacterium]|nr:hypothetical protein [Planctomycetota bacterium]
MNLGKYLKSAFLNRWNLLLFLGASGLAFLSGRPDVFWPLVIAAEVGYLGLLGTHPKFQRYVDAQAAKLTRDVGTARAEEGLLRILRALPARSLERYESLRARCLELRQLALEIKDPGAAGAPPPLDSIQLQGLDRLLWIFLRLLYTHHSLERFLETTSGDEIGEEIERLEARLRALGPASDAPQQQRVRKALEDNLATCKARLENHEKARSNCDLVALEIDRLENKIRSLSEIAVNRHEPDFITSQVDEVATSMVSTEKTMSELRFATGLELADEEAPELLRRDKVHVKE